MPMCSCDGPPHPYDPAWCGPAPKTYGSGSLASQFKDSGRMSVDKKDLAKRLRNDAGWISNEFSGRVQVSKSEALTIAEELEDGSSTKIARMEREVDAARKSAKRNSQSAIESFRAERLAKEDVKAKLIDLNALTADRNRLAAAIRNIIENDNENVDSRMLYNNMLMNLMELADEIDLEEHKNYD